MPENESVSAKYKTIITDIGNSKIAKAVLEGGKVDIETAVISDGGGQYFMPTADMTELPGEVWRGPIKRKEISAISPNVIDVIVFLDGTVGGWTARGIGLLDSDGDLIAVGNMPDTVKALLVDGAAATLTISMKIVTLNVDALEFKIDPSGDTVNTDQMLAALGKSKNEIIAEVEEGMEEQAETLREEWNKTIDAKTQVFWVTLAADGWVKQTAGDDGTDEEPEDAGENDEETSTLEPQLDGEADEADEGDPPAGEEVYVQTVECDGLLAEYDLEAPQVPTTGNPTENIALKEGLDILCGAENHGETLDGALRWTCYGGHPGVDLPLRMRRAK